MLIKRIVALPGDFIRPLPSISFLAQRARNCSMPDHLPYIAVPQGHIWVEGDNHYHSQDSHDFGPVRLGLLTVRCLFRWLRGRHTSPSILLIVLCV